jgi:uncharacterized protein YjdB
MKIYLIYLWLMIVTCFSLQSVNAQNVVDILLNSQQGSPSEATPYGVPSNWDWVAGATLNSLSAASPYTHANYWGAVFRGQTNTTPSNTQVQIKFTSMWVLYNGASSWFQFQTQTPPDLGGGTFTPTYNGGGPAPQRLSHTSEGTFVVPAPGYIWHFWYGNSYQPINDNIREMLVNAQVRLVLINPGGTDDRAQANYLVHVGADKRNPNDPSCASNSFICPSFGVGKFVRVTNEWKNVTFHSVNSADISGGVPLPPASLFANSGTTVAVTGVSVSPTSASVAAGATTTLTATVAPSDATNKTVSWTSSNTSAATVNSSGVVTGVAAGSATITVTTQDGSKTATCAVTVTPSTSTKLTGTIIGTPGSWGGNASVTKDKVFDGNTSTFFDSDVASGAWVGLDLGTAKTISQIKYAPRPSYASRMIGGKFQGSSAADFSSGVVDLLSLSAAPTEGVLTTAAITNTTAFRYVRYIAPTNGYGNISEMELYTSGGTTVAVTGITVSPTTASVAPLATTALTATVAPSNATNKTVSWSSNNTSVATVNASGVVTGVAAGSATITVTTQDGSKTATCVVTVTGGGGVSFPIKIMPMGNSITQGDNYLGYRDELYKKLEAAGYTYQTKFVPVGNDGTIINGQGGIPQMGGGHWQCMDF